MSDSDKLLSLAADCEAVDLGHVAELLRELAAAQPQPGEAERLLDELFDDEGCIFNGVRVENRFHALRAAIRALESDNAKLRAQLATARNDALEEAVDNIPCNCNFMTGIEVRAKIRTMEEQP